jgi:uncharacterized surface protein with fasciclin (FAS1) repeats
MPTDIFRLFRPASHLLFFSNTRSLDLTAGPIVIMQRTLVLSLVLAAIFAAPLGPLFFAPSAALFAAPLAPPFAASLAPLFAVLFAPVAHSQCLEDVLTAQNTTLSTLYAWLQSQELVLDTISRAQGVTLLAPSNNALDQLYASQLPTQLANDPNLLVAFLSYHALPGVYFFDDFLSVPAAAVPSFMNMAAFSNVSGGQVVRSRSKNGGVTFVTGNNAESNVQACVRTPASPSSTPTNPLKTQLQDFTYDGGTLHIIDSVLTIPGRLTDTLVAGGLTSFAGALQRAGVESTLNNAKDVTVFAPYNDAFNAISSLVNAMTPEQLSQVLSYHVVRDKVLYSWLIADGTTQVTAAGGARLNFRVVNGALYVNSARVIASDVLVGNGVVHVLDSYVSFLPSSLDSGAGLLTRS